MNEFKIAKEVFMSLIKWFLGVLVLNNLIWAIVVYGIMGGGDISADMTQNGHDNIQEMTNG